MATRRANLIRPMTSMALLAIAGLVLMRMSRRSRAGWLLGTTGGWLLARAAEGASGLLQPRASATRIDPVAEASEESFPASDPPSWSPTRAGAPV